ESAVKDTLGGHILVFRHPGPCKSLKKFLKCKGGRVSEHMAREFMVQAAMAVKDCIDRGVYHEDITLGNFLVNTETRQLLLHNFSKGQLVDTEYDSSLYRGKALPVEFKKRERYLAEASVVSALGCMLYTMVNGGRPRVTKRGCGTDKLTFRSSLSTECQDLIIRCLNQKVIHRATIQELLEHEWFQVDLPDHREESGFFVQLRKWQGRMMLIEVLVTDVPPALAGAVAPMPSTGMTPQPPAVAETEETEPSEVGSGSSGETFQIKPDMQWKSPARMLMAEKGPYQKNNSLDHPLLKDFATYLEKDLQNEHFKQEVENVAIFLHFMDPQQPSLLFVRNREKSKLYFAEAKLTKQTRLSHLKSLKRRSTRSTQTSCTATNCCKQFIEYIGSLQKGCVKLVSEEIVQKRYGVKPVTSQMAKKVFETAVKSLDDSERDFVADYLTRSTATADEHYRMKTQKDVVFARKLLGQLGDLNQKHRLEKLHPPFLPAVRLRARMPPEEKIDVQKAYDTLLLAHPVTLDGEVPDRNVCSVVSVTFQRWLYERWIKALMRLRVQSVISHFGRRLPKEKPKSWLDYGRVTSLASDAGLDTGALCLGQCHRAACFFD
ncbi:putative serine/threonine-protein kinase pim-1-like, partial [Triplophysa rosa]